MRHVRAGLRAAVVVLLALTVLTGIAYPAAITGVAQAAFPAQANGSFVTTADGARVGSILVGQAFSDPRYLWPRPSAAGSGYDGMASGGSNLAQTNPKLIERVTAEAGRLRAANGDAPIPVDLVTASGSGLDPAISPAAAEYQVARIAAARGIPEEAVRDAIARHTAAPILGFLGRPAVSVLAVNLDLEGARP